MSEPTGAKTPAAIRKDLKAAELAVEAAQVQLRWAQQQLEQLKAKHGGPG